MISTNINNVVDRLRQLAENGTLTEALLMRGLRDLRRYSDDVAELERLPIPGQLRNPAAVAGARLACEDYRDRLHLHAPPAPVQDNVVQPAPDFWGGRS